MNKAFEHQLGIQFDQYQRYKIVSDIVNKYRRGQGTFSILEIGASYEENLKNFLPDDNIYFLDIDYPEEYKQIKNYIIGDITKIELKDEYDFIVSIDCYEHVLPNIRTTYVEKLIRQSRKATVIAAPFDTTGVKETEILANDLYRLQHGEDHRWLKEHIENGLPSLSQTIRIIEDLRFNNYTILPNGYLARWFKMMSVILVAERGAEYSQILKRLSEFYNHNFYKYDNTNPAYRQVIVISKISDVPDFKDLLSKDTESDPDFKSRSDILQSFIERFETLFRNNSAYVKDLDTAIKERDTRIGSLEAAITEKDGHISQLEGVVREKEAEIDSLKVGLVEKVAEIGNLKETVSQEATQISDLKGKVRKREAEIKRLKVGSAEKVAELGNLKETVNQGTTQISYLEGMIREKEGSLNHIYNSSGWKALLVYYRLRDKIFPPNTKRRLFSKIVFKTILGPTKVFRSINKTNLKKFIYYFTKFDPIILEKNIEKKNLTQAIQIHCDKTLVTPHAIEVAGWAISHNDIDRIEVYCDNILLGHAAYGQPRPDVKAAYPFVKNSGNSGFSLCMFFEKAVSPGEHDLLVKAIDNEGQSTKVEQRLDLTGLYPEYLTRMTPDGGTPLWMRKMSERFVFKPFISFQVIMTEEAHAPLLRSIKSIIDQPYPLWNINLFYEKKPPKNVMGAFQQLMNEKRLNIYPVLKIKTILSKTKSDFIGFILPGGSLASHALFEIVKRLNLDRDLELIYTDEDAFVGGERREPFFKPDWSPDLLLSMNYIGQFFLLRRELYRKVGGLNHGASAEGLYDLLLRVTEHTQKIGHIPSVLYTRGTGTESSYQLERRLLEETLIRRGIKGELIPLRQPGTYRVKRKILNSPKVTIIILTAYKSPDLFWACLRSIVERSSYKNYDILLVDNSRGSLPLQELEQLIPHDILYQTVKYREAFNFSRMNNLAAKQADGDFLIFLNDDTEVISPEWIESMLEHAQRPDIGVVGAKLLYQNDTIQHAGMILVDTGGGARHAFRFHPRDAEGYQGFLGVTRNCSGVTFACAMVSKKVFLDLDGLDENLRIECNDTDYCLRAIAKGYLIVWTPFALLYHCELITRGRINCKDDMDFLWGRWRHFLEKGDPYYNANLTLDSDHFSLNERPVLIEHHGPHLPIASGIPNRKGLAVDPGSIRNILVMKLDHIGDFILSLPAVKMIKAKFPKARITLLAGSWVKPIAEKVSEIDNILTFNFFHEKSEKGEASLPTNEMERLERLLRSQHFDLAIDLRKHPGTRKVLKLSGARYTAGYDTKEDNGWLTISLKPSVEIEDIPAQKNKPHMTAQLCQLVQAIDTNNSTSAPMEISMPALSLTDKEITDILKRHPGIQADYLVGIHPGVGSRIRQWPIAYFARLADMLIERNNAHVVLFGGEAEKKLTSQICDHMHYKDKVVSLAGDISLEEFLTIVRRCHLFIGNVSGPCHMAAAMGVPTLTIFAGQVLPHEWHPLGDKTMSVRLGIPCAPCYKSLPEQCPYDLKCLKFLWPEKIYEAALQLITIAGNPISQFTPVTGTKAYVPLKSEDHLIPPPGERNFVGEGDFRKIGEDFLKHFISLGDLKPDERVLDVGCGIGRMAIPLTKYLNKHGSYEGFDVVPDGINWCRENISPRYPNFQFQIADLINTAYNPHGKHKAVDYRFPYEKEYFDFVFLISVFTHMLPKDMENYFHEVSRVLRKNGRCFITFFLLNNESRGQIRDGKSTQNFKYTFKYNKEQYLTINKANPEAALAFDERFVRDLYERTNLVIAEPIYYGSWCGRPNFLSYQDIIAACKKIS